MTLDTGRVTAKKTARAPLHENNQRPSQSWGCYRAPVWTSAVLTPRDFALALAGFLLLTVWKAPPWIVVVLLAAAGALLGAVPALLA